MTKCPKCQLHALHTHGKDDTEKLQLAKERKLNAFCYESGGLFLLPDDYQAAIEKSLAAKLNP